jgi:hypothetical protein
VATVRSTGTEPPFTPPLVLMALQRPADSIAAGVGADSGKATDHSTLSELFLSKAVSGAMRVLRSFGASVASIAARSVGSASQAAASAAAAPTAF